MAALCAGWSAASPSSSPPISLRPQSLRAGTNWCASRPSSDSNLAQLLPRERSLRGSQMAIRACRQQVYFRMMQRRSGPQRCKICFASMPMAQRFNLAAERRLPELHSPGRLEDLSWNAVHDEILVMSREPTGGRSDKIAAKVAADFYDMGLAAGKYLTMIQLDTSGLGATLMFMRLLRSRRHCSRPRDGRRPTSSGQMKRGSNS